MEALRRMPPPTLNEVEVHLKASAEIRKKFFLYYLLLWAGLTSFGATDELKPTPIPSLEQVLQSKLDLWGEAAMHETNGASYEFFQDLLPPPRYVNADFHYYPIVLSAPNAKVKARLISNGSGVNLRAGTRSWNEPGTPVTFRVGPDELRFGDILNRVEHPTLAKGYLPIYQIKYAHAAEVYQLEAFASTDPDLAEHGVVLVKFSLASGTNGLVTVQVDSTNEQKIAWFDQAWSWDRQRAHSRVRTNKTATLAIATKPFGTNWPAINYDAQRQLCADTWEKILAGGMNVETPEPLVNNAWRHLICQDFAIINGNRMNYSAGNQYEKMYAAESSDSALPLMLWGYENDMRRLTPTILDLVDKRLTNHFASHKLDDICRYYWQTRDTNFVQAMRPRWQKELDWILNHRGGEYGLLPKDNYCTDIEVPVYSFSSNAKCWAALRDLVPVLEALGDTAEAKRVAEAAVKYKKDILAALEKNIRYETTPPFIPCALFYDEGLHDPIIETRIGSYWNLVQGYIIGSGIFVGTERATWLPKYIETHGGLIMGMIHSGATNHTFWTGKDRTNPLYGLRYNVDTLERDDPERALVSFYGMLAHGMTRNTFIGAEGCSVRPLDEGGRFFYCPPNTSSSGQWLWTLRDLLVQDFDLDNDGQPETLRLAFGTPRRWLEDGKTITVERAPTAFGPVSFTIKSHLEQGEVLAEVSLPKRNEARSIQMRFRLPQGWNIQSAKIGDESLAVNASGTINLSGRREPVEIRVQVKHN